MPSFHLPWSAALALPLALAACGERDGARERVLEPDPAIAAALAEPIMTDPDLAAMNRGNAAIALDQFDGIPAWTRDPNEIEAAHSAAVRLAGGQLKTAPEAGSKSTGLAAAGTARQFVATLPGVKSACITGLGEGFAWAADMPKAASLYPGAHVEQAAGSRTAACALRSVRYVTAAAPRDVLDFHYTLLSGAGYDVARAGGEGVDQLTARKGASVVRLQVVTDPEGMTRVTLASRV